MTDETDLIRRIYEGNRKQAKAFQRRYWIQYMLMMGYEIEKRDGYLVATEPDD